MPKLVIATSNLNRNRRALVAGSAFEHQQFLELAGYRQGSEQNASYRGGSFEWSEARNINNLAGSVALELATVGDISALHQSWRSTRLSEILARLRLQKESWSERLHRAVQVARSVGVAAIIPFIDDSLDNLAVIQGTVGRKLSVVVHPNEQQPPDEKPRFAFSYLHETRFAELRHQPTAETLNKWGVLSNNTPQMVEDMLVRQKLFGFGGVAWNTKRAQEERHDLRIPHPDDMVTELARHGALPEFHLTLTEDPDGLRDFLNGADTYHGTMLQLALGSMTAGQELYLVTKATAADFASIGIPDETEGHRQLLEVVTDMAT